MITAESARNRTQPPVVHPSGAILLERVRYRAMADAEKISIDIRLACQHGERFVYSRISKRNEFTGQLAYTVYQNCLKTMLSEAGYQYSFSLDGAVYIQWI